MVGNSESLNHFLFQVNDLISDYLAFSFKKSINRICHCQVVAIDLRGHGEEEIWKFYLIKHSRKREINLSNACCAASQCKMYQFHKLCLWSQFWTLTFAILCKETDFSKKKNQTKNMQFQILSSRWGLTFQ